MRKEFIIKGFVAILCVVLNGCASSAQQYIQKHPDTPAYVKQSMRQGKACVGMTKEQLAKTGGQPLEILQDEGDNKETWVYDYYKNSYDHEKYYVTLKEDKVVRVEFEHERGYRKNQEAKNEYIKNNPGRKEFATLIKENKIAIGMNQEEVKLSRGMPIHVNRTVTAYGVDEQWVYGSLYLYFDNGILTSWQD